jgi:class 3 adenylate cyclase
MSLRYRLFLWVSGLFVVVATCSYFLENYVSQRALAKTQLMLRKKILAMSEERRLDLQNFLASAIGENQVRIDAILSNIASFSPQALRFGPTEANAKRGTWGEISDLLLEYKWVDFFQNTNEGRVTAAVIPEQHSLNAAYRIDIDGDLSWIYLSNLEKHPEPYLGVRVPYSFVDGSGKEGTQEVLEQVTGVVPSAWLLFEVGGMIEPRGEATQRVFQSTEERSLPPIQVKWTEGYELDLVPFVRNFQRARELLLAKKIQIPSLSMDEIGAKRSQAVQQQDGKLVPMPKELLLAPLKNASFGGLLEEVSLRYTQTNMIWVLLALFDSGIFGGDLFQFPAPSAATVFSQHNEIGVGVIGKEIFFPGLLFEDAAYYSAHAPTESSSHLATSLAVIPSLKGSHVFLGNTAKFTIRLSSGERTGYLTLGIDADAVLQRLVLATRQAVVLVHGAKALSAYSGKGRKMEIPLDSQLPVAEMLGRTSGSISWNHRNWFYMNVQPFPEIDLHFLLFNPEEKEFALLHDLDAGSEEIVTSILLNIHIAGVIGLLIAVLVLNNISRRITRPIIQLAKATKDVAQGKLEEIRLLLPPLKHNDEVALLCHSFEEMVQGLQEKEKVKGVLNKVVSREIAQEILQGSVHLGGEEKRVTVLFADIRDFTKITQTMAPQEVIELLNTCMTKISQVIDKNNGVIDKYVGDEAMALFGAPVSRGEDALHAIRSGVEMLEVIREWNRERTAQGKIAIELGIGIHTGQMLAGNMGAENRLNYTVIGSHVNLAARLCSAAKRMEILISKDTLQELSVKEHLLYEEVPALLFKGFDRPVDVYRVLGVKQ